MKSNFKMKFAALTVAAACALSSMPVWGADVIPATSIKLAASKPIATDKWFTGKAVSSTSITTNATFAPSGADKAVTYSSNNPAVVAVMDKTITNVISEGDAESSLKAVAPGTAIITVQAVEGYKTATYTITVLASVKHIALPETASVLKGKSITLKPVISPSNAANKALKWSSSAPTIASAELDGNGKVTGVAVGSAVITAKDDTGTVVDTCTVTVGTPVTALTLTGTTTAAVTTTSAVQTVKLIATITPGNVFNNFSDVTWKSSNENVLKVPTTFTSGASVDGTATTVAGVFTIGSVAGTATITVTSVNTPSKKGTLKFQSVKPIESVTVDTSDKVGEVTVDGVRYPIIQVGTGVTKKLKATIVPADASMKNLTWTTASGTAVTMVNGGGVKGGTAVTPTGQYAPVTVSSNDNSGKSATFYVQVVTPVKDVKFKDAKGVAKTAVSGIVTMSSLNIAVKGVKVTNPTRLQNPLLMEALVTEGATDQSIEWTSSNSNVATKSAIVTATTQASIIALTPGKAVITATNKASGKKATYTVTVPQPVYSVTINKTTPTVVAGGKLKATAIVNPTNATTKGLIWSVSGEALTTKVLELDIAANSDKNGVFKAKADTTGTAIIVARSIFDPRVYDEYVVTVTLAPTGVVLGLTSDSTPATLGGTSDSKKTMSLAVMSSASLKVTSGATLTASITPSKAVQGVVWTSNKPEIASVVSSTGYVVAKKPGTAVITATSRVGGKTGTVTVTVLPLATKITIPATLSFKTNTSGTVTAPIFTPANTGFKGLLWSITPKAGATGIGTFTIDQTGKVTQTGATVTGAGLATVTVKTTDGGTGTATTATCTVSTTD